MNFKDMYEKVKSGSKARRTSWKDGEYLFWAENFLVHNTPYYTQDVPVPIVEEPSYYYVVEKDDPSAQDWEII
jgi:hypothetical protein